MYCTKPVRTSIHDMRKGKKKRKVAISSAIVLPVAWETANGKMHFRQYLAFGGFYSGA